MTHYLKRNLLFITLAVMVCSSCSSNSSNSDTRKNADAEIQEGGRAFKAKHFDEAKQHFEKALTLDPSNQKAAILLARVHDFLYEDGDKSPLNVSRGNEAISAYKKVLAIDPNNREALNTVIFLLGDIGKQDEQRQMVEGLANNSATPAEMRSDFFASLASMDWDCSYAITGASGNRVVVLKDGQAVIQFKKPKDQRDFDKALSCTTRGLESAEKAISLNPNSGTAWAYKTNLLLEAAKLAEMEGVEAKKAEYRKQADESELKARQLHEKAQSGPSPSPSATETELDSLVPPRSHMRLIKSPEEEPVEQKP